MTDARELVGLPVGGPTSLEALRVQLTIDEADTRSDTELESIAAAVNSEVRTWAIAEDAVDATEWPDRIIKGATVLGASLFRRKNSPGGSEVVGSLGVYAMRNEPEAAMLLKLGTWQRPQVG